MEVIRVSVRVDVVPDVLTWAVERAGWDEDTIERRAPHFDAWLSGAKRPTLKQLEKFAGDTHTPFGSLFLPEPPTEDVPIPDMRTMGDEAVTRPSADLLDTIYLYQTRQDWYRAYAQEQESPSPPFVGSATLASKPENVASQMCELMLLWEQHQVCPDFNRNRRTTMNLIRRYAAAIAFAASLILIPIPASAEGQTIVTVDGGPTPIQTNALNLAELSQLRKAGLTGSDFTVQRKGELILVTDGQGGWTVTEDETPSKQAKVHELSFGAGICEGKFFLPKKINANVEWGAYETCATLGAAQVYVHSISADLRMQTGIFNLFRETQYTAVSPLDSVYSKTVTAHRVEECPKTTKKDFDVVATVTLKSVRFNPHISDSVTLECDFEK